MENAKVLYGILHEHDTSTHALIESEVLVPDTFSRVCIVKL